MLGDLQFVFVAPIAIVEGRFGTALDKGYIWNSSRTMTDETVIIYNESCPICSREIEVYRSRSNGAKTGLRFEPIHADFAGRLGLSTDDASRRLHAYSDGRLHQGVDAFVLLWSKTPGFEWLARFVSSPIVHPLASVLYEGLLAPLLYWMHVRRTKRRGRDK